MWNSVPNKIERKRIQRTRPGEGRTDKRKKVSPWISERRAEEIHDIARYLTRIGHRHCSDGEAAHRIIVAAFFDDRIINRLAEHFWRDYERDHKTYPGHPKPTPIDEILDDNQVRAHIRFSKDEWRAIGELAFATGTDLAPVVAALLILGIRDEQVTAKAAPGFKPRSFYSLKEGTVEWR